ncbi:MAG: DUF2334 domain-containing protein [Longimicrobiales bacterium]|nr:DUF2334 domain-containing protein [Longimicrobiales bacterium]
MTLHAHATVHDVRPDTLDQVSRLLDLLRPAGPRVALLVVPGLEWTPAQIARLARWAGEGYELAGHGWVHRRAPRTLHHRVHARLLSRDQAEHLSASRSAVRELVDRGREWFDRHDLPAPHFYVPPAWALGAARPADLAACGYTVAEVLRGFLDLEADGRLLPTPLVGFEADTAWREYALGVFNAVQATLARRTRRPLRIGLHPFDLELRRADEARARVAQVTRWLSTDDALAALRARDP